MATKRINITDIFEAKMCGLCGSNELSQFFGINENFVEYSGTNLYFKISINLDCLITSIMLTLLRYIYPVSTNISGIS